MSSLMTAVVARLLAEGFDEGAVAGGNGTDERYDGELEGVVPRTDD